VQGVGNFATKLVAMATSLEILKKIRSILYTQNAFIWCKIAQLTQAKYIALPASFLKKSEEISHSAKVNP